VRIDSLKRQRSLIRNDSLSRAPGIVAVERVGGVENPQFQQLPRVVPFVHGVSDVEPFVALQSNQIGLEHGRHGRCERRLADTGFTLEEQRTLQTQREKQRDRQAAIGHVMLGVEAMLKVGDGVGERGDEE
jgi:hypothetical protein